MPRLTSFLEGDPNKAAQDILARAVLRARERAAFTQDAWEVHLDLTARRVWLAPQEPQEGKTVAFDWTLPEEVVIQSITLAGGTTTSGQVALRMLPTGLTEPCRITLVNTGGRTRHLVLEAVSGRLVEDSKPRETTDTQLAGSALPRDPVWEHLP
ncbi:hypothetical protein [Solidesulfovibrio fructosivorans]|uniref:hypothetical protein n=1 Tax=Solidesulfovibrio fructosivorans TaxID=878 RepID=UPI001F279153|nr:hypothetical protein [Solidesulfovibrio fructosivorans]